MNKLKITKVYFPTVTVIKVDDGVQSRYYTSTQPGEIHPALDVVETEFKWQEVLAEAKAKGARVEVEEFLLQEGKPAGRLFLRTYGDWVNLAEDIKERIPNDPATIATVNYQLNTIAQDETGVDEAKRWLTEKAGELGMT